MVWAVLPRVRGGLWRVLRQRVQIFVFFRLSPSVKVTLCTLGANQVFVRRFEWLTLFPDMPIFPHTSHFIN